MFFLIFLVFLLLIAGMATAIVFWFEKRKELLRFQAEHQLIIKEYRDLNGLKNEIQKLTSEKDTFIASAKRDAVTEAERIIDHAQNNRKGIIIAASNEAKLITDQAQKNRDDIIVAASNEAKLITDQAQKNRDDIIVAASNEAKLIIDQAQNNRDDIISTATNESKKETEKLLDLINRYNASKRTLLSDIKKIKEESKVLNNSLDELQQYKKELSEAIKTMEKDVDVIDAGLYKKQYDFDSVIKFERALAMNREKQEAMIRKESAWIYQNLSINEKLTKAIVKLALAAFNGECDAFVASVNFKNVIQFESKIRKIYERLNKTLQNFGAEISFDYMSLKIEEVQIVHEFQEKKEQDAEEQRRIKEIMREELKAQKEFEAIQQEAEREEKVYTQALEKALAEANRTIGEKHNELMAKVSMLEIQLKEAQAKKERAKSQAELTKSGHVYVISNIGSFGENVFKIGMTRRLEPMERVYELSGASVPFPFDVHVMIYSENAPELENKLHMAFENNKINKVNPRKEFFKIDLNEIEVVAKKHKGDIIFKREAEAKEYRISIAS